MGMFAIKIRQILSCLLIAGFVTAAQASPIQFIDTYQPGSPVALSGNGASYSYSHYITFSSPATNTLAAYVDTVLTAGEGYNSATDSLLSGTLSLYFTGTSNWTSGKFDLSLGGNVLSSNNFATVIAVNNALFNVSFINAAGVLDIVIKRTNGAGTANFTHSVLNIAGERATTITVQPPDLAVPSPVPAPATLALLGCGLLALGLFRRRQL